MSALLVIICEGQPLPWQRASTRGGQRFTPAKQRGYQEHLQWAAIAALGAKTWDRKPCFSVELDVYRKSRTRYDLDNAEKQIGDALNGVVWDDDSQIVEWRARKLIDRGRPRVEIRIRAVPDPTLITDAIIHGAST